jgi:hypothetical protein
MSLVRWKGVDFDFDFDSIRSNWMWVTWMLDHIHEWEEKIK